MLDARQHRWVADLKAVEMQDRQNRAIGDGIEKLIRLPGGCQRAGLCLTIANDTGNDQTRIIKCSPERMA